MDYADDDCLDARGEVWQGECRRCGAEGFEDKTKD